MSARGKRVTCTSQACFRGVAFNVCSHAIAIAFKEKILCEFIEQFNKKKTPDQIKRLADAGKEAKAGQKKTRATQKRKGPPNSQQIKVRMHVASRDATQEANQACTTVATAAAAATAAVPNSDGSEMVGNNPGPSSDAGNVVGNMAAAPGLPQPTANGYMLSLLRFCHRNVAKCYQCGGKFYENGYPRPPLDMVIVTKTQRWYIHPTTKARVQSNELTNVYFHFNFACISAFNQMFTPPIIVVPMQIRPFLLPEHRNVLQGLNIGI